MELFAEMQVSRVARVSRVQCPRVHWPSDATQADLEPTPNEPCWLLRLRLHHLLIETYTSIQK
jgi:hypothetical protein